MNLIIDQGNSYCKLAVFEQDEMVDYVKMANSNLTELPAFLTPYAIDNAIIASVSDYSAIQELLNQKGITSILLSHKSHLPIELHYETPETLGLDRIAATVGAWQISPETTNLIIDIGTCITYDIATPQAGFIGGNIAPGLDMRLKAMHQQTQNLPLLKRQQNTNTFGKSTHEAIRNGAERGIIAEINSYMATGKVEYGKISTFLTGGDASYFEEKIKNGIFVVPNLVLVGLHEILKIN